jgi:hypothetical protein
MRKRLVLGVVLACLCYIGMASDGPLSGKDGFTAVPSLKAATLVGGACTYYTPYTCGNGTMACPITAGYVPGGTIYATGVNLVWCGGTASCNQTKIYSSIVTCTGG